MNLEERLQRSKNNEEIDFTNIGCLRVDEPMVPVVTAGKIIADPVWNLPDDFEGGMYADYIAEHPEYDRIYLRESVFSRLQTAADSLSASLNLVIQAGHRPLEVQHRLLGECIEEYKSEHPGVSYEAALEHARTFISDPDIQLPPHCCGAAVDVGLFDVDRGVKVDFGGPINLNEEISFLHFDELTQQQRDNRMQLLKAMLGAGFASYHAEWWHYSYGDEIWAWFYGKDACLYDLAEI